MSYALVAAVDMTRYAADLESIARGPRESAGGEYWQAPLHQDAPLDCTMCRKRADLERRAVVLKRNLVKPGDALEIDQVIDPVETRRWIIRGLDSCPAPQPRASRKRPFVDTW